MRLGGVALAVALGLAAPGCDQAHHQGPSPVTQAGSTTGTVRIVFQCATARRTNLPPSAQACVNGAGATHTHPSWRGFTAIPMLPVHPDRYEVAFMGVPVDTRVSFRVDDQNACDEDPTGAVTRNIFVNDTRLVQN